MALSTTIRNQINAALAALAPRRAMTSHQYTIRSNSGPSLEGHAQDGMPAKWPEDFSARIPFIDGVRAVSIMLVLTSHVPYSIVEGKGPSGWIYTHGDLGVRTFFVLSGFLITGILATELIRTGTIDLRAFYLKRAFRLMPVYWSYLAIVAAAQFRNVYHDTVASWVGAITYTRNVVGQGDSLTVQFWSLAIEEQFYFVWPALLLFMASFEGYSKRRWVLVMILMLPLGTVARAFECSPEQLCRLVLGQRAIFLYMDSILMGCLLSSIWLCTGRRTGKAQFIGFRSGLLCAVRLACLVGLIISTTPFGALPAALKPLAQAAFVGGYILLLLFQPTRLEFWLLENPIMVYIGRLSYSLYVWHVLFLVHFNGLMFGKKAPLVATYWLPLSFVAAIFSYHLIERPARKYLTEHFVTRIRPTLWRT